MSKDMTAHTPGPWTVTYEDGWTVKTEDGVVVAKTDHASARLIAAAPELLEALEQAEKRLRVYHEWADREFVASRGTPVLREIRSGARSDADDARAAIAKAKGGAS